ncbi:MAG: SpoIIE family protein phosphatase [Sphingobacteriaceae bacterium]|nr:SpoIIE family protein phosphatase [Sphingobacteriaceae bacterium]
MSLSKQVDKLIYSKDKDERDTYLKGRYFVYSTLVFFVMALSALPYYFIVGNSKVGGLNEALIGNLFFCVITIVLLFVYRKYGFRILIVNVLTFLGWVSNFGTYQYAGGLYSADNIWGIVICSWVFLVAGKKSGIAWAVVVAMTLSFYYIADVLHWRDFRADTAKIENTYYFIGYVLAILFIALIIIMFQKGSEQFLKEINVAKSDLEEKSKALEIANKDVMDSIHYAYKIQTAVLPNEETIQRSVPLFFILYKPKAIVSGDFYWFYEIDEFSYLYVNADCTGHGVPGAFMTVIASNLLNQTVIDNKIYQPSAILNEIDRLLNLTLKQDHSRYHNVQDGMDCTVIKVNKKSKEIVINSAKRPVAYIQDNEYVEIKSNRNSIGGVSSSKKAFEDVTFNYKNEDMIYLYTDGYHDQFGGPKGKKYSSKRLKDKLISIHKETLPIQKELLATEIKNWQGELEQIDDICITGIRF